MSSVNLTTLFGINPAKSAATNQAVGFRGGVNHNVFQFEGLESKKDAFSTNPVNVNFKNKAEIELLAKSNPRIMALLKEYNLPLRVNMDVLEEMR